MKFEQVLDKIKSLNEEVNSYDNPNDLDRIFAEAELDLFLDNVNLTLEKATEDQAFYARSCINDILHEADIFYSKEKVKKKPAIMIRVDAEDTQGDGFYKDPYITIYDGKNFKESKNLVRVSLKDGNLVNHKNEKDKGRFGHLPANAPQLDILPEIMQSKCNSGKYKGKSTVKDAVKDYLVEKYRRDFGGEYKDEDLKFCDFTKFNELRTKDKLNKVVR